MNGYVREDILEVRLCISSAIVVSFVRGGVGPRFREFNQHHEARD